MIQPKHSLQILQRPEAQGSQTGNVGDESEDVVVGPIVEHDEPENPIHPELEYEVLHEGEDSSTGYIPPLLPPTGTRRRRKRTLKNDVKLLVSFICLVIFGYVSLPCLADGSRCS